MKTPTIKPTTTNHNDKEVPDASLASKSGHNANGTRPAPKLSFPPSFQTRVLRLCLEQPEWIPELKPSYFDYPLEGRVFKVLADMPQPVSLKTLGIACLPDLGKIATLRVLRPIQKPLSKAERTHIEGELPKFLEMQRFGDVLIEAGPLYQRQDVEGLQALRQRLAAPMPGDGHLRLVPLTDVKMQAVPWLWKYRVARGEFHLVGGEPGEGKSAMVLDWIARLTRGHAWPDGSPGSTQPQVVVILSAEDAAEYTIKPRLKAAGADMTKVLVLDSKDAAGLSLVESLTWLESELVRVKATVLVIDSINDFIPKLDIHRINEVKSALGLWTSLAARRRLLLFGITHLNKNRDGSAAQRFIGSVGFIAQARLSFLVAADDKDLTRQRKLMVPVKNNLGPLAPTLAFRKETVFLKPENGSRKRIETVKLSWTVVKEPVDATALLRKLQAAIRPKDVVANILRKQLRHGPVLADTILDAVKAAGATEKTARRVKEKLKIGSVQRGGRWYWTPSGWSAEQITAWSPEKAQVDTQVDNQKWPSEN